MAAEGMHHPAGEQPPREGLPRQSSCGPPSSAARLCGWCLHPVALQCNMGTLSSSASPAPPRQRYWARCLAAQLLQGLTHPQHVQAAPQSGGQALACSCSLQPASGALLTGAGDWTRHGGASARAGLHWAASQYQQLFASAQGAASASSCFLEHTSRYDAGPVAGQSGRACSDCSSCAGIGNRCCAAGLCTPALAAWTRGEAASQWWLRRAESQLLCTAGASLSSACRSTAAARVRLSSRLATRHGLLGGLQLAQSRAASALHSAQAGHRRQLET